MAQGRVSSLKDAKSKTGFAFWERSGPRQRTGPWAQVALIAEFFVNKMVYVTGIEDRNVLTSAAPAVKSKLGMQAFHSSPLCLELFLSAPLPAPVTPLLLTHY